MLNKLLLLLKKGVLIAGIASVSINANADDIKDLPSGDYTLDLSHASIVWKVSHFGLSNYTARFNEFDATLQLDTANYANSSITVDIKTASLDTDYPFKEKKDFNKKLISGENWFNGSVFPEIRFVSTKLEPIDSKNATLSGDLTFLGITKPVVLDVIFNKALKKHPFAKVPAIGFSASTKINRSDWGFVQYISNIGDEVSIDIEAEFQKKN